MTARGGGDGMTPQPPSHQFNKIDRLRATPFRATGEICVTLPLHPLATLFPPLEDAEFAALKASIAAHGLIDTITTYDGCVLDGRNRQAACDEAGVACRYEQLSTGADPLQFVLDKNLRRRHLNESQRAFVAAKLANIGHGGDRRSDQVANLPLVKQDDAAALLNVSARSVRSAVKVQSHGAAPLQKAVERGLIPVSAAAKAAEFSVETQTKIAQEAEAGRENVVRLVVKQEGRAARERTLGAKQCALPDKRFGVIVADPEWRFEPHSRETGLDRAADNHYPTSSTEEIMARDVASIAAKDCVLFLWATAPMLPDALRVMEAWGFAYKTHLIWHKTRVGEGRGSGYWATGEHELLLIGTRGAIVAPAVAMCASVIAAPWQGRHSAKPSIFLDLIEDHFPTLPKIELNRRGEARPGWVAWGNEAETEAKEGAA
jgi:N6-adenosine-specific RNA methylase IME4